MPHVNAAPSGQFSSEKRRAGLVRMMSEYNVRRRSSAGRDKSIQIKLQNPQVVENGQSGGFPSQRQGS